MDIKTLKTFVCVAKLNNFSAAAKELNTVQPTVSRHVSDLENEVGVKLFLRTTHSVELTKAGKILLPEALNIISNDQRVKRLITEGQTDVDTEVSIGYLATACSFFLPKLIGCYSSSHSTINIEMAEMTGEEQYDALIKGKIDIAFSRRQPKLDGSVFHVEEVYSDRLVAVVPSHHPLADRSELAMKELANNKFILFEHSAWAETYEHILLLCQENGFSPNIMFNPNNMRHLITSISSGLGISIAPRCIRFIADGNCVCIPIREADIALPLYIYYRRDRATQPMLDFIQRCLEQSQQIQITLTE